MYRTITAALIATAFAAPALAQDGPPPSPRVDRPTCTMDELKAATSTYVEGQKAGSLAALPLHEKAQYLENMTTIPAAEGMWNAALEVDHAMSFHDPVRCKTFTEVIVTGPTPYVIGTRLYLDQGKVIRVDSLVTTTGHWLFNANAYLKYARAEDWGPLMKYQGTPASEMIRGANAYLDAFADKFVDIPWGQPCARLEGGAYTNRDGRPDASCEVGIPPGVLYIVNRDYLIDPEKGVINVFCRFGNSETGAPDSHTFRFIDGKIRLAHTLNPIPGPQATDDGAIVRGRPDPNAS